MKLTTTCQCISLLAIVFTIGAVCGHYVTSESFSDTNNIIKIIIIGIGALLCLAEMCTKSDGWGKYSVRVIATTLLITAALLTVVGNSSIDCNNNDYSQNVAPFWGLLGAIAGYVLGEHGKDETDAQKNEKNTKTETITNE